MKKYLLLIMATFISLTQAQTGPGEEADITGKLARELTAFQNIRNLAKGLFWTSYTLSRKNNEQKTVILDQKTLHELMAVLIGWDRMFLNLIDANNPEGLLNLTPEALQMIKNQIAKCTTMQNIINAFSHIPKDVPTVPVFMPQQGKDLFDEGHFNPNAYTRKHGIYKNGQKAYQKFIGKYEKEIHDNLKKSGEAIMHLNDYEDR